MARPAKPKTHPLLAALIELLPAGGTVWPQAKRAAWLDNMARAFDTVYDSAADDSPADDLRSKLHVLAQIQAERASQREITQASAEVPPAGALTGTTAAHQIGMAAMNAVMGNVGLQTRVVRVIGADGRMHDATVPVPPPRSPHDFYIDADGFARRGSPDGERIMPGHVTGAIYDMRGESGDPGAIIWADGSRGVRGLQIDISAG